jgi:hypothetical protein
MITAESIEANHPRSPATAVEPCCRLFGCRRSFQVKVLEIDKQGRIRLSMRAVNSSISSR